MIEEVVRAQNECMASWELEQANRAWDERRAAALLPAALAPQAVRADGIIGGLMASDVILETRGLTKEFRGFVAVKDVTSRCGAGRSTP